MFSIGDFARHGRVSVRMLRHYDAIGLLQPASVDPSSGYRFYDAGQLTRLNRIVALKDLGFTLEQVGTMLADDIDTAELRGMLKLRGAELAARIEADTSRLAQVAARLDAIDSAGSLPADVIVKPIAAVRVAELTGLAAGFEPESIGPVIRPLFASMSGIDCVGHPIAYYEDTADGSVLVHAAIPVAADPAGYAVRDLPAVDRAATSIHRGSMDAVLPSWQALARWVDANGERASGPAREATLQYPDMVTELQIPL